MWGPVGNVSLCIRPSTVAVPAGRVPGVNIPSRGAFGSFAVRSFAGVVLGPDRSVEDEWPDDGEQGERGYDGASHPRKTSTMSLVPEVASR
jgi:hypothetical protein